MIRPLSPLAFVLATSLAGGCVLPSYEVTTSSSSTSSGSGGAGASSGGGGQGASGGTTTGGGGTGGTGGTGGATCGDTTSDPANCGRCGHACPGGLCVGGECEIQVMQASSTGEVYGRLVVDAGDVYWISGGDVLRIPKTGMPGDTPIPISTQANAEFLAQDGTNIYFTIFDAGTVLACTKAGGAPYPISQFETYPTGLTVLGNNVYWARHDDTGIIREHNLLGSSTGDLSVAAAFPFYVATDGADIYWTYRGMQDMGGVQKFGGAAPVDLVSVQSAPSGLAVDADHVYWLSYDGSFARTDKTGGAPVTSIGPAGEQKSLYAGDVVLDATHVYWPGPGATSCQVPPCACDPAPCGKIWRALKASPVPEVFAEGDWGDVAGMAADDVYIYWTTGQDGRLMRKSKLGGG